MNPPILWELVHYDLGKKTVESPESPAKTVYVDLYELRPYTHDGEGYIPSPALREVTIFAETDAALVDSVGPDERLRLSESTRAWALSKALSVQKRK